MIKEPAFTIDEVQKTNSSEIIIKNNSTEEFVSIIPEYGGRIKELWLNNGKKNLSILKKITRIDSNDRDDIFANAKLSPFAGRIKDGQFNFNNTMYNLFVNYPEEGNACHGFIYYKKFLVIGKIINEKGACCKLEYQYKGENQGYPFKYSIEIDYMLSASDGLTCTTKIVNKSGSAMPLSDGWHNYFDIGIQIDDLELKLDVSEIVDLDSRNIPTQKKELYTDFSKPSRICSKSFDSCFKINSLNGRAVTELISAEHNIHLNIWQETGNNKFEYLVIYTPPDRKSIAIEPMTSNVNSFNNGEGLIQLATEKEYVSSYGIYLSKNGLSN
jgi:aldose 1-epimerase